MKKTIISFALFLIGFSPTFAQLKLTENNIDEIVKAMTLEEKSLLVVANGRSSTMGAAIIAQYGIIGEHADFVEGAAGSTMQISRLGIPPTVMADGPAGLRINATRKDDPNTYYCTGFPTGTSLACSWNTDLIFNVGASIGNEVKEYGVDLLLAPGMNIMRNPLGGRNYEYYSEDPVVSGLVAAAYVKGVQSQGVGADIKHYAVNSQETNRLAVNEVVDQRALREIYLKGFEIAVKESKPWTIMSSYNRLNGKFTQQDRDLLTTILRDEWNFDGIVITDWTPKRDTHEQIKAGNDLMAPGYPTQSFEVVEKVKSGELSEADLDICVKRILEYIVKTPRFKGYKFSNKPDMKSHAAITRQSATEGMVLLKNENNALPLKDVKTAALFGATSYSLLAGGLGSGHVYKPYTVDLVEGLTNAGLSVTEDLKNLYVKYRDYQLASGPMTVQNYSYPRGQKMVPEMALPRFTIENQATKADVAILTIARQAGEGADRVKDGDFNLTDMERDLLQNICDAFHILGKKVIVVLNTGVVIETDSWKNLPDAILLAWQPGQEGGNSIADVLMGKENPSGKLTMTWPISLTDVPSSQNFPINGVPQGAGGYNFGGNGQIKNRDYTLHAEGINVGYRYFNTHKVDVSYPFGYGLSYTSFSYSKPAVKATKNGFEAAITVTNTGKVAGKESVQLYVSAPAGGLEKPACELKSFAKTKKLNPGESETLHFKVDNYSLASFSIANSQWEAAAGKYTVLFGANVEDVRGTGIYNLAKAQVWPVHNVLAPDMELK